MRFRFLPIFILVAALGAGVKGVGLWQHFTASSPAFAAGDLPAPQETAAGGEAMEDGAAGEGAGPMAGEDAEGPTPEDQITSISTDIFEMTDEELVLLQSLSQWSLGSFATIMQGRYEYVWIAAVMVVVAWVAADRFSVIGMGEEFATNLGLDYRRVVAIGMVVIAVITSAVLVTAGMIPFLGLVVPNIVSLIIGDNVRRSIPWVAGLGAVFVLACDIVARTLRFPYEIPLGVVVGVVGAGLFLWLLLRRGSRAH